MELPDVPRGGDTGSDSGATSERGDAGVAERGLRLGGVERLDGERQARQPRVGAEDGRDGQPTHAVAGVDDEVRALIDDMIDTMYDAHGIGLAAIRAGVPRRVLVIDLQEPESDEEGAPSVKKPLVFINPEILDGSDGLSVYNEGCLSVPDQYAEVERPATIRASWMDRDGRIHEEQLEGLLATCLQHEMDHLQGVLFIDHLSRLKRDMLLKKLDKARKAAA